MTISGSQLPVNKKVELTWSTADDSWVLDPEPDTVNCLGRSETKFAVVLATTTTSAHGSFSVKLKAPDDFGGVHDIYAVINGVEDAHGGFILLRSLTVSPRSGPIGTPITITYSGMGASEYEGGASLLYDSHFAGEMMANWTRGSAEVTIRASGPVGKHLIEVGDAVDFLYLNLPQSTLPYAKGGAVTFTVTKDDGPPKPSIDWPVNVAPTVSAVTTLQTTGLSVKNSATATLKSTKGPVDSTVEVSASGVTGSARVQLVWSTVLATASTVRACAGLLYRRRSLARRLLAERSRRRSKFPTALAAGTPFSSFKTERCSRRSPIRRGEHCRQRCFLARRQGGPGIYRPPEGRWLDTARQHRRG
jgi:hypothetical protein